MDNQPFITTTNKSRLHVWRRLFRSDRVPVKVASPRWQLIPNQAHAVRAYDLDASRLLPKQRERLKAYIAGKLKVSEAEAEYLLDGWPIPCDQCEVVADTRTAQTAPLIQ